MSVGELRYRDWVAGTEIAEDPMSSVPAERLAATLDADHREFAPGTQLPPLWHWAYMLPAASQSALGPDGHPARGGFYPPIELPCRMYAGSQIEFHRPLEVGHKAARSAKVVDIAEKLGRSGPLCFVTVEHRIVQRDELCITERQQIVYREGAAGPEPYASGEQFRPGDDAWTLELTLDPVLLFRFSALTFNAHRIHYDLRYAMEVEHYPGLIVHAPLTAVLLAEVVRRNTDERVKRLDFQALASVIAGQPVLFTARRDVDRRVELRAIRSDGRCAMSGTAILVGADQRST